MEVILLLFSIKYAHIAQISCYGTFLGGVGWWVGVGRIDNKANLSRS